MTFAEKLMLLNQEIEAQYGIKDGIVKVGIAPELMDRVIFELRDIDRYSFRPMDFGELIVYGVQLVARRKDTF